MNNKSEKIKNVCSYTLLISFILGALLFFRFRSSINSIIDENNITLAMIFLVLLLVETFNFASITGVVVMPIMTALFGVGTAAAIFRLKVFGAAWNTLFLETTWLLILIPMNFIISGMGMIQSIRIRAALCSRDIFYRQSIFISYSIMFISFLFFILLLRYIINI